MAPKYILEQFLQQELLINITEHEVGLPGGVLTVLMSVFLPNTCIYTYCRGENPPS